jgi:prepilin-type processing-associated H-X9-DG protein
VSLDEGIAVSDSYLLVPEVNAAQEFIEIANDFANPLDLVREAISNSFDAKATDIRLAFEVQEIAGESTFVVRISDNGHGMDRAQLKSFFDLGNSTRRGDPHTIGEKGHGTKVFFNCSRLQVDTQRGGQRLVAILDGPFKRLHAREVPDVSVSTSASETTASATVVEIFGYNNNRRERFTHQRLKDHIQWFTKFGSVGKVIAVEDYPDVKLHLKGLDADVFETMDFGHPFPPESKSASDLFDTYTVQAPDYYSRRLVRTGSLPNHPEVRYNAVFSVEGKRVKYDANPLLRRPGYTAPSGSYTVQERYGLWLCKDFIPVQRKNEWITTKGSEFTRLHAFFNCQALKLTANRGSIENTPAEIMRDVEEVVRKLYDEIVGGDDWVALDFLEQEADSYNTVEKEKKSFALRVQRSNKANIARLDGHVLVEPNRESGVHALVVQLMILRPGLFPFQILDYDTHEGIDVIVKAADKTPIVSSKLYYVEFKFFLANAFNHSFENLHSVVCWDTGLKHNDIVKDINREERKLSIVAPDNVGDYTRYYLENPRKAHRIEVFVLKSYLEQKLALAFHPRTSGDLA